METMVRQRALGEDSLELRELNERLESYLHRVTLLEQENTSLRSQVQALKNLPASGKQRELEGEVGLLRGSLVEQWREVDQAALERDNLQEEVRLARERCASEVSRRSEAKRRLGESQRELEEGRRGQAGLEHKVLMLEGELKLLEELHREEVDALQEERARSAPALAQAPAPTPTFSRQDMELYAQELSQSWKGCLHIYQKELGKMERGLAEVCEKQETMKEMKRQSHAKLQSLQKETASLRERKALLQGQTSQQSKKQQKDLEELQLIIGQLEQDKDSLAAKTDQILDEQRQLMQAKLELSLEVITYRALLDAETGRIHTPAVTLGLSESHRDARLEWEQSVSRGRRAASTERTWHPWKGRDGDGDVMRQRAASRPGTETPAYASGDWHPPRAGRSKEPETSAAEVPGLEVKVGAHGVGGAPRLSYDGSPIVEHTAVPPRGGMEGGERSLAEAGPRAGEETKGQAAEGEDEAASGQRVLQEGRQLNGDANEDVIEREESEGQVDLVMETILLNDTHQEPLGDEEPLTGNAEEDLVAADEERRERLTEGKSLDAFNLEQPQLQFSREIPEIPAACETIERAKGRALEEPQVNGDAEERGIEKEHSEGKANPEAGVVKHSSPGSGEVAGGDSSPDVLEAENGNDTETKENVRGNWSEQPTEEKDPVSPNPLSNGTTGEHAADERLNEGLKGHTKGDQTPEVLEGPMDAVPERTLSSDKAQELVPGQKSHQTEVEESGTPEGIDLESEKEISSDTSKDHSTEDMSQTAREPRGRDTEEGALGMDISEVTSENGQAAEDAEGLGADETSEVAELPFDSTPEDRLLGDGVGENVLEESDQGMVGELTGEKIPAPGTLLSTEGHVTEEAEGEVPDVRTDPEVEQEGADGGMEGREIEEGLEAPKGKVDAESVKLLPSDNKGHTADGEILVSDGVEQLLPEMGQHHGDNEEPATDREMSRGKSEGARETVLPINPPEENAEGERSSTVPGEEEPGPGVAEGEEEIKENSAENKELENSAWQNVSQIDGEKGETFERTESLGLGTGCLGEPIQECATDQETCQAEGLGHQVAEGEDLGTEVRHSDGAGHGREKEPSEIAEELVNQEAEERLPLDPKQGQVTEDTKFLIADQEVDLGSEMDQLIEEATEDAVAEADSEGMKGSPGRELLGDAAKGCATDEEPPTSEGRGDLAMVKEHSKEDSEHATDKDSSVGKGPEEIPISDLAGEQEKALMEEGAPEMPAKEDGLETGQGQFLGGAKEDEAETEQLEIAEEATRQATGTEPASDVSQEQVAGETIPIPEGKDDQDPTEGQLEQQSQQLVAEDKEGQTSKLNTEAGSGVGPLQDTAQEDVIEETTGGMQDLLTERELFNGMTEEDQRLVLSEEELELKKRQHNEERMAEGELADVPQETLFSEATERPTTEENPRISEGMENLGSEEGQLIKETEEHIEEDRKAESDEKKVAADGDDEDDEVKTASPVEELDLAEDKVTYDMEETQGERENVHQSLARSQSDPCGNMEKGRDPLLDEPSESEERQEMEEERAASPFVPESRERQTEGEESLTSPAAQALNEDWLAEELQSQSLLEREELTKGPDGADGSAEVDQEDGLKDAQEVLIEARNIGSQSLDECPGDVSLSHECLYEAGTTSGGVPLREDTAPWEDIFSESSVNAEDVAVREQQTWAMEEGTDLPPGLLIEDTDNDKSGFPIVSDVGDQQAEPGESLVTSSSNGEGSSTRGAVAGLEDDGPVNLQEAKDESLTQMADSSQAPATADVFEDVTLSGKTNGGPTPLDMNLPAASDDGGSLDTSQTQERSAAALGEHGENLEPLLPENPWQEISNGTGVADEEKAQAVEGMVEGRKSLNTETHTLASPELGGDLDQGPREEKGGQVIEVNTFDNTGAAMGELATAASQEAELVQSTSPEEAEASQGRPREEAERRNSFEESQLGPFNGSGADPKGDTVLGTAGIARHDDEGKVPGELVRVFREDVLRLPQDLCEELDHDGGKANRVGDAQRLTGGFFGLDNIDGEELGEMDASQRIFPEIEDQEVDCHLADLAPPSGLVTPSQEAEAQELQTRQLAIALPPKDLNGRQGGYTGSPGKGEGPAVEPIAAAYRYWSSEDE